ncbi:MAG: FtsX-like permease family protein [Acidobacteriota bacterium]|jgi:hypothetical protein
MDRFRFDVVYAFRSMRTRPSATAATVGVLALGIGLTATMFALADPFLLRPLPYAKPSRLVIIENTRQRQPSLQSFDGPVPTIDDWRARTDLFEALAAYGWQEQLRVRAPNGAAVLRIVPVSEDFFDVLGIHVNFAEPWHPAGAGAERPLAVFVGPRTRTLGAPAELVGNSFVTENAGSVRVAAVLPPEFVFPIPRVTSQPDALTPATFGPTTIHPAPGMTVRLIVIARRRPGVTPETVQRALSAQTRGSAVGVSVQPIQTYMTSDLQPLALGALAAGLMISFVSAANVANLLIARGAYRTREFALREALGASRLDLLRLILVELGVLTAIAMIVSLALAHLGLAVLTIVIPAQFVALGQPTVTLRVVVFAGLLGAGIVFANTIPAWGAWRTMLSSMVSRSLASEARKVKLLRFCGG